MIETQKSISKTQPPKKHNKQLRSEKQDPTIIPNYRNTKLKIQKKIHNTRSTKPDPKARSKDRDPKLKIQQSKLKNKI